MAIHVCPSPDDFMDNFRSTFPLDEPAIHRLALLHIFNDPVTWSPLAIAAVAYAIFHTSGMATLGVASVASAGIGAYWQRQWSDIVEMLRRKTIVRNNQNQNAILQASADELRRGSESAYAFRLEEFLAIKFQVEQRLHAEGAGTLTTLKIQLEQLIDSLCFGVRDQLVTLARKDIAHTPADVAATLKQVDAAYETLRATSADMEVILAPEGPAEGAGEPLEEITRRLREEADIARRVQARLRGTARENPKMTE